MSGNTTNNTGFERLGSQCFWDTDLKLNCSCRSCGHQFRDIQENTIFRSRLVQGAKGCCGLLLWNKPLLPSLFPTPHWYPYKASQLSTHLICITCPSLPCEYSRGSCASSTPPSFFFYHFLHKVIQYLLSFPSFRSTMLTGTRAPPQDPAHTAFLTDAVSRECKRLFLFLSNLSSMSFLFSYKAAVNLSLLLSPHLSLLSPVVPFSSSP